MKPNALVLIRFKLLKIKAALRIMYYRFLGMQILKGVRLGTIECYWPNKISIGEKCIIEDRVSLRISHPFAAHNYIAIGDRSFLGCGCEINTGTRVVIGNDCLIASNTTIVDTGHEIQKGTNINLQPVTSTEIIIGDDVWIGTQCIIIAGVTIGKGSIIGAGSLVNKSIPEYQIWGGSPARFIKNR